MRPHPLRVLCADDDADIRTIIALGFELDPAVEAEIVESGPLALARARAGRYDAIVLDGRMPGMDGYETCRRLKADPATSTIPVVFLTAEVGPKGVAEALDAGAVACLAKPFDPFTLATRVRDAVSRQRMVA